MKNLYFDINNKGLFLLRSFQPIVLLGGGTTRIGDPSGKDKTRKIWENGYSGLQKNWAFWQIST